MRRGEYRKFRMRGDETRVDDRRRAPAGVRLAAASEAEPTMPPEGTDSPSVRFLDDFAAMRQVVTRRYRKLLEAGGPFPDLIVIDGGKGQLAAAYEALESLGLANLVAVGLAKKEELVFTREHVDPIGFAANDPALLLLQQIRDEAHRFAVTFHRKARSMRDLRSELDAVPGIGPRRRRTLLTTFGSLAGVRRATREELVTAVGTRVADAVLAYFSRQA
jgi:excinuclease ABC subunit C